jgi:hypothetical protein
MEAVCPPGTDQSGGTMRKLGRNADDSHQWLIGGPGKDQL